MHRDFDDSRVLVSSPLGHLAAPLQLILAATALWGVIGLAAPAHACPYGPRPTDPTEAYVAVCTGVGPDYDKFITTRFDKEDGSYVLSAFHGAGNPHGVAHSSARVSEARFGDIYLNPDLHASVSGEAKSIGEFGNISGSIDAAANVSFRDVIFIHQLPPGNLYYPFVIDFDYEGTLAGTGDSSSASQAWANVVFNLSLYDLEHPDPVVVDSEVLSTLPQGEAPVESVAGLHGPVNGSLKLKLYITEDTRLVIEGSIDMLGNATGGDPLGAIFNADFSNSVRFRGIHIYTDDTLTTELTGYTIESAFGFDYRVNPVPEPTSLALLAIVGVLFGTPRRKWFRV